MPEKKASPHFTPISMESVYNKSIQELTLEDCSEQLLSNKEHFLTGEQILTGIPFSTGSETGKNILVLKDGPITFTPEKPLQCYYMVFLHGADFHVPEYDEDGIARRSRGIPILGETVAEYVLQYTDGATEVTPIKRRFQINEFQAYWGEAGLLCVPHTKSGPVQPVTEWITKGMNGPGIAWGQSQTRVNPRGSNCELTHWLFALENPYPDKEVKSIEFIPKDGTAFIFGLTTTDLISHPLNWEPEKRIKLKRSDFDRSLLDIDLGVIIHADPEKIYDDLNWESTYINQPPEESVENFIIEYTAHPDAILYYGDDKLFKDVPVIEVSAPVVRVNIKVIDKNNKPVAVKLHIHGVHGEYLPPMDRHRYPNPFWFEDYSADFTTNGHFASYIDGSAEVMLPPGVVYIEVTKGPEIKPVKLKKDITAETTEIIITIDHILPWRQKGWVSADTHVHFLSPDTARLEGSGEGVNVVNLLASQWGELFTNVGDFDGKTTMGSLENGGDGEYLVRVGTENRQPILGHISLLGYEGDMILPLTCGGPSEARLGDAIDTSLSLWAEQNKKQGGLTVLPHFPEPRTENAASIVLDLIDAVEMTSWNNIFGGISHYSLSEWYKYLNCGFHIPAVGGSDKMSSMSPVGGLRTYALIKDKPFTYESWKESVSSGLTFVTCGPLIEFLVDGKEAGSCIDLGKDGGTLDINWQVSSLLTRVTKVQIIFNGDVKEVKIIDGSNIDHYGSCSLPVKESGWIALRVFGKFTEDHKEMVAAHTSAVMIKVGGKPVYTHLDAMSILEQIEGATAFVSTIAPKGNERQYADIMSRLNAAHRKLHNMMHENHVYHDHSQDYLHHHK